MECGEKRVGRQHAEYHFHRNQEKQNHSMEKSGIPKILEIMGMCGIAMIQGQR